jgi:hypothetical protein
MIINLNNDFLITNNFTYQNYCIGVEILRKFQYSSISVSTESYSNIKNTVVDIYTNTINNNVDEYSNIKVLESIDNPLEEI